MDYGQISAYLLGGIDCYARHSVQNADNRADLLTDSMAMVLWHRRRCQRSFHCMPQLLGTGT